MLQDGKVDVRLNASKEWKRCDFYSNTAKRPIPTHCNLYPYICFSGSGTEWSSSSRKRNDLPLSGSFAEISGPVVSLQPKPFIILATVTKRAEVPCTLHCSKNVSYPSTFSQQHDQATPTAHTPPFPDWTALRKGSSGSHAFDACLQTGAERNRETGQKERIPGLTLPIPLQSSLFYEAIANTHMYCYTRRAWSGMRNKNWPLFTDWITLLLQSTSCSGSRFCV